MSNIKAKINNKFFNIFLSVSSLLILVNWSQTPLTPRFCSGIVITKTEGTKELVDIKIGLGSGGNNHNIKVFQKPANNNIDPTKSATFFIDLDKVKIITYKADFTYTPISSPGLDNPSNNKASSNSNNIIKANNLKPEKYINIIIKTKSKLTADKVSKEDKLLDVLVPVEYRINGKLKANGVSASYPLNSIKELKISNCQEAEIAKTDSSK